MARKLSRFSNPSLYKSLRPACFIAKLLGVFPFKVVLDTDSNSNTFSLPILSHNWFSQESLYSFLFILGFGATSYVYLPFIFYMDNFLKDNTPSHLYFNASDLPSAEDLDFLPDIVFLIGLWLTGLTTLILVHFMCPGFVKIWNRCQACLSILDQLQNRARLNVSPAKKFYSVDDIYKRVVITTALFLTGYFLILIGYTVTYMLFFWHFFFEYCVNESYQPLFIAGFPLVFIQVIGHLLHTVIFCTVVRVLERMFFILHILAADEHHSVHGEGPGLDYVTDVAHYIKLYRLFCSIEDIARRLGANYGFYLIVQAIGIMATILVNLYGIFFYPRITAMDSEAIHYFSHSFILPPIAIFICIGSLLIWCNLGEVFQRSANRTMKSIRDAAIRNLSEECNFQITAFQYQLAHNRVRLRAAGFFSIHRKLLGQIIALMMTYMIFLLQIRLL